ncbi:MAG: AmmeMemoRadiSam system protein B, partial [Planctomycetota bacterium]
MSDSAANPPSQPVFDPSSAHQTTPRVRHLRAFPLQAKGPDGTPQNMMGLADAQQISHKMVATAPAAQMIIPHLDGTKNIDEIVAAVGKGLTREFLEQFVAQLDDAALLFGPNHDAMVEEMRAAFDSSEILPPSATADFADALVKQKLGDDVTDEAMKEQGPAELAAILDKFIEEALKSSERPPFEELPRAVIAPHIDYQRGWQNYANVWGRLKDAPAPDRVVILGTNHFGSSSGVCGCDKGFSSPLGTSPLDTRLLEALTARLGEEAAGRMLANRYDHEREHSIELHMPWIHHTLASGGREIPVFAALIHDPTVNDGQSYDGNGLDFESFVDALKGALEEVGGTTLIVSSADLSHCGVAFGDQVVINPNEDAGKAELERIVKHDREMLTMVEQAKADDLISSMSWQQNPTRWCSLGNMTAAMKLTDAESVELLNYFAAVDSQGTTLVSHAAM